VKIFKYLLIALPLFIFNYSTSHASDDLLSLGVGYYDVGKDENAADFRVEYRWGEKIFWQLKPWIGAEGTTDGALYGLGGFLVDWEVSDHFIITPSVGAGLYSDGGGKDLGHAIEFRSQLEFGYHFTNNTRMGLAFGHISNASIGDKNPGTEILSLYYHLPVTSIFGAD
jgi:hypothetical protein